MRGRANFAMLHRRRSAGLNDVQSLVAALGGDSVVKGIYDTRYGVTAGATVSQWDDARGAAGFGPSLVAGATPPTWDAVNKLVTTNGTTMGMATAAFAGFDFHAQEIWYAYIGSMGKGTQSKYPFLIEDSLSAARYIGPRSSAVLAQERTAASAVSALSARGSTRRLFFGNTAVAGPNIFAPDGRSANAVVIGRQRRSGTMTANTTAASNIIALGQTTTTGFQAEDYRAIIVGAGPFTQDIVRAIESWAAIYHPYTRETARKSILFSGDSLTFGQGVTFGTQDYPKIVMNQVAPFDMTTNYDYQNLGKSGEQLFYINQYAPFNCDPGAGFHVRTILVLWAGTNDIYYGRTSTQVIDDLKAAGAARRAAGHKTFLLSPIPRGDAGFSQAKADELVLIRNWCRDHAVQDGYFDYLVPNHLNPNFNDFSFTTGSWSNATWYNADKVHLTAAGYADIATNATYGVYAALVAAGIL